MRRLAPTQSPWKGAAKLTRAREPKKEPAVTQRTKAAVTSPLTVGIDIGDKACDDCVLNAEGEVVERKTFATTQGALRKRFARLRTMGAVRVALEVGAHSPWISRTLKEMGFEVFVANAHKVQLISRSRKKTDRGDAELLARLCRADPGLLCPIEHRGAEAQADLGLLRARGGLVAARTQLINQVRGSVKPWGLRIVGCSAECFHLRAAASLPDTLRPALEPIVRMVEQLTETIKGYDKQIEAMAKERYPETQVLRQVKGVGPITAATFVLTLESPDRIHKARNVAAYFGLVPAKSQSGGPKGQDPELSITKAGDATMRSLLVSCAQYILGPFGEDCDLRRYGQRIADKGNKSAKKRAVIAVARKLSVLLLRLWQTGGPYEPLRNSKSLDENGAPVNEPVSAVTA
jgi:transposase